MGNREKPSCPKCPEGADYTVTADMATKTSVAGPSGVWDENGDYHPPIDPNTVKQRYTCSNGHSWTESRPADPDAEEKRRKRREAKEEGLL